MKEVFTSSGYSDFKQRYANTYGWYEKEDKSQILVNVASVDADRVVFRDDKGIDYFAYADFGNVFTFLPVQRGLYWYEGSIIYMSRLPARQYKRGICDNNTSIFDMHKQYAVAVDYHLLKTIFGKQENPSLEKFKTTYTGDVLFNKTFAIIGEKVFLYNIVIGTYNTSKKEITLENSLFQQELQDVMRINQLDIIVEVKTI